MVTTKTCREIENILNVSYGMYVQTIADPHQTHALYGVSKDNLEHWKEKIKSIGGKSLRVVTNHYGYKIVCFRLDATPQEETAKKIADEKLKRYEAAYESKLNEIALNPMVVAVGATNLRGQKYLAKMWLDGDLDTLLPLESYIIIEQPNGKDEKRIYDIISKANAGFKDCSGMISCNIIQMEELARRMNKSITDEDKRARRRAACLRYGLNFLAKIFA